MGMQGADDGPAGPSARAEPATAAGSGRPVRFFLQAVGLFLLAVVAARLLLDRGNGWILFLLALPFLLLFLSLWGGLVRALLLVGSFAAATLAVRAVLATPRIGWGLLLLVPVLALSAFVAARVAAVLVRRTHGPPRKGEGEEEARP
jgi:hypothetical protein